MSRCACRPTSRHVRRAGGERLVRVALAERARDIGQPRAEQEGRDALARVGDGMQEMQEQPRVLAHRAGNIEQRDDRRLLLARAEIFQVDHRAARLHAGAQRAAHVDHDGRAGCGASRRVRTSSSGSARRVIASLAAAISAAVICAKSFFCSTSRSDTVRRASSSTSGFVLARASSPENSASWMRCAPGGGAFGCARRRLRQHRGDQLARDSRACGRRCGTPGRTGSNARAASRTPRAASSRNPRASPTRATLTRRERIEHRAGTDRNAGGAQRAREVEDVFGEAASGCSAMHAHSAARSSDFTSSSSSLTLAAVEPRDVVLVLQQHAERVRHRRRIERDRVELGQRARPSRASRRRPAT